ncbi:hypothetical protein ACFQ3W_06385 [Paenibacillus puldeungensis]|uniref:Uncharacterized protein n=1 Tax=Paenibacillus puldeungensis TaxID=696536 RepID=A0ABW3RUX6_9BACL
MNYRDYKRLKLGPYQSAGMIGDVYAFEILTGIADTPEYYQITKEEFDSYEDWSKEFITDLKTLYTVVNRKCICSGYLKTSDYRRNYHFDVAKCPECGYESVHHVGEIKLDMKYEVKCPSCNNAFFKIKD